MPNQPTISRLNGKYGSKIISGDSLNHQMENVACHVQLLVHNFLLRRWSQLWSLSEDYRYIFLSSQISLRLSNLRLFK